MVKQMYHKMLATHIFSSVAAGICSQIDIILIGQFLGVNAVAAYGIATPAVLFLSSIAGLFTVGIATVCSGLVGKGDKNEINANFSTVIAMSLVLGIIPALMLLFFKVPIAVMLGAKEGTEVFKATISFFDGYAIGLPAYMLIGTLTSYLHIAGKGKLVVASITTMTVLNVSLGILNGVVFKQGMLGMGLATSIGTIAGFLVALTYFLKKESMFKLSFKKCNFSNVVRTVVTGSSVATNQLAFTIGSVFINRLFANWGNDGSIALAAFAVFTSLVSLGYYINSGIGGTTQTLVGIFYGENDKKNIVESLKSGLRWVLLIDTVVAGLIIIFAKPVVSAFINGDSNARELAIIAVRMGIACIIPAGIAVIFKSYYPSVNVIDIPLITGIFENLIFVVPIYYAIANVFMPYGIWTSTFWAEIMSIFLVFVLVWFKKKSICSGIKNICLLDDKQFVDDKDIAGFDIRKKEDISSVSEKSGEFCRNLGLSEKLSYYIALCIEEMAVEFAERGFKENRNNLIQVKIVNKDDHCIIRMRDNCKNFDPVNYMKLHENEDGVAHLGIRMVFKMVLSADYMNSLGINCLTLKVKKD